MDGEWEWYGGSTFVVIPLKTRPSSEAMSCRRNLHGLGVGRLFVMVFHRYTGQILNEEATDLGAGGVWEGIGTFSVVNPNSLGPERMVLGGGGRSSPLPLLSSVTRQILFSICRIHTSTYTTA